MDQLPQLKFNCLRGVTAERKSTRNGMQLIMVVAVVMASMRCLAQPKLAMANGTYLLPPLPDTNLTSSFEYTSYRESFSMFWSSDHEEVSEDTNSMKLKLDSISGSGIKSKNTYFYGFFSTAIKLPANYSAGVVTTFYLSNGGEYQTNHDEIDFEFLGVVPGEAYTVQTNVYGNGSTDTGREQRFHLWFDPAEDYHQYSILWAPTHIVFLVDNVPIREFQNDRSLGPLYPSKPMSVYATIWDASAWATDGGQSKADYSYEPFVATYSGLILHGCNFVVGSSATCAVGSSEMNSFLNVLPPALSRTQFHSLNWVRQNYMIYDYCRDKNRYPAGLPGCPKDW